MAEKQHIIGIKGTTQAYSGNFIFLIELPDNSKF